MNILDSYRLLVGDATLTSLLHIASVLKGIKIVHVNSTYEGGGVAEILSKMIPLSQTLGLDIEWKVIQGNDDFFRCTKMFHNLLQGQKAPKAYSSLLHAYEKTTKQNAACLEDVLVNADIVFIHDPQPLALLQHFPHRKGKWFWRCHIDLSSPSVKIWNYLKTYIDLYDASIYSLKEFAQHLSHPIYIIPPSIDPFCEKNIALNREEITAVYKHFGIDTQRPSLLQVSRFDQFKDPLGVIAAYRIAKQQHPDLQLILAGSGATDDPEGEAVYHEAHAHAQHDPNIHLLLLPPTSHRTINALQRGADIILQKSLKEGFGLTVAEALWKSKPVIGGNVGGIRLQVLDEQTGFLVTSIAETSARIAYLLENPQVGKKVGENGKQLVKDKFLLVRHLLDYLSVMGVHLLPEDPQIAAHIRTLRYTPPFAIDSP